MKIIKQTVPSNKIDGVVKIELDTFSDSRGQIWTVYSEEFTDCSFVQDKVTFSKRNVLRGFHGDSCTTKMVCCLGGEFQLAIVDLRENSETYGNSENYLMSVKNPSVVVIPAGCINAHLCLTEDCTFYYKWTKKYNGPENQVTVAWDDPDINFKWPIKNPTLSERDSSGTPITGIYL